MSGKYLNLKPVEYDNLSDKVKAGIVWKGRVLLPKYDGCMAMVFFQDGVPSGILSRTGEVVQSMDHIYDALLARWPSIKYALGGYCFLGEAWIPGEEFGSISGKFRRHKPQVDLGFAVFDQVNHKRDDKGSLKLFSGLTYFDRVTQLTMHAKHDVASLAFAPVPALCEDYDHALRYAKHLKATGSYDGAVAGNPHATYVPGSGSAGEFLKVKPLLSFTLEVVGYDASTGEKTGRPTGALVVRFKETTCKVATGLNEAEQASLGQFRGKLIEVQCMGVYPGDTGLMREPRYCGIRDDVIKADY